MTDALDRADIQGIVARGYSSLGHARFTLFACDDQPASRALLGWLLPRITSAARKFSADTAVQVAFTPTGLHRLGLPEQAVAGFSLEFLDGMAAPNRSRFLGDIGESAPRGWVWGGPDGPAIDGLILLYASSAELLDERQGELARQFAASGARPIAVLDTLERQDREPFGFHDGISQPLIQGLPKASRASRSVPAGEFVLGYRNGYRQLTDRPMLPGSTDPRQLLPPDPGGSGQADLGRNGTYLVLRQLEQDVEGFWRYVAEATRRPDGSDDRCAQDALAAKLVGRWRSGAPLVKAPHQDNPVLAQDNDFSYQHTDPLGLACPLGAHIRRANPRDSLDPAPGTDASLQVNSLHRLLRRGRSYGPGSGAAAGGAAAGSAAAGRAAAGGQGPGGAGGTRGPDQATGLYFICLAASLARQFEFVQHTWLNDPTFNGLYDDADPLTGSRQSRGRTFTVPARPVRRRYRGLPQFAWTRGGAYFFLPGISALRYLQQLPGSIPPAPRTG
jgi:Dyp-type peroxidase family